MNQVKDFLEYIFNAIRIFVIVQPWQTGIRVRSGKKIKKLNKGMYFKLPYFDSVFIQESRLRISEVAMQTLTSKDMKTLTVNSSLGYSINDVEKLYNTLYHPETTLQNIIMGLIANYVYKNNIEDITPDSISEAILSELDVAQYGLNLEFMKITNFAIVRTYRIIQDSSWNFEGLNMNDKK